MKSVPVVLFIYNRTSSLQAVLNAIAMWKPEHLFIIADGGKDEADAARCTQVRQLAEQLITWPCNVYRHYRKSNLGCATSISEGLSEVLSAFDAAIILEDDCVPSATFFPYCCELLERYSADETVMHISGYNILGHVATESSYVFTKFILPPWGWATWRRAWRKFNPAMDTWQTAKHELFRIISQEHFGTWTDMFEVIRKDRITWDVSWNVDLWNAEGVGIIPCNNLVENRGFGPEATFTRATSTSFSFPAAEMSFPLKHARERTFMYDKDIENSFIGLVNEIDEARRHGTSV